MNDLKNQLAFLEADLINEISEYSIIKNIPKGTEIMRESQYIKVLPVVLKGLVKVYSRFEERELLLYYIQPSQSCIMSFSAGIKNKPSKIFATTEEDSEILLIPVEKIPRWLNNYPNFNQLFYDQYDLRYTELLDTIEHVLINKMDKRLYDYLVQKTEVINQDVIKISHHQIANELGTVREVISRVIKKLEIDRKLTQTSEGIKVLR